jgi:16S rRNA (guanine966-N2)-methyltransferase
VTIQLNVTTNNLLSPGTHFNLMRQSKSQSSLRIIGGQWRGRKISFLPVDNLRPTSNRIRETLFNWLQNHIVDENCLDLFAGSGACGIEGLSRGARSVTFIETNSEAAQIIKKNLAQLKVTKSEVVCADAMSWLTSAQPQVADSYGLVFIDPPFKEQLQLSCCQLLEASGVLKSLALIYLESATEVTASELPANWQLQKSKKAGKVHFFLFKRNAVAG